MSYNRWMPQEYQSGGELYHYGVKGMKWHQHKAGLSSAANGGGLANPIDSIQEAWWQFEDDSGITDYYKQKEAVKAFKAYVRNN